MQLRALIYRILGVCRLLCENVDILIVLAMGYLFVAIFYFIELFMDVDQFCERYIEAPIGRFIFDLMEGPEIWIS